MIARTTKNDIRTSRVIYDLKQVKVGIRVNYERRPSVLNVMRRGGWPGPCRRPTQFELITGPVDRRDRQCFTGLQVEIQGCKCIQSSRGVEGRKQATVFQMFQKPMRCGFPRYSSSRKSGSLSQSSKYVPCRGEVEGHLGVLPLQVVKHTKSRGHRDFSEAFLIG